MKTRDEVLAFSEQVSGTYSRRELGCLYDLVVGLPDGATIVEIGVEYGRSASVYFQVAQSKPLDIVLVDNWCVNESDTYRSFHLMVDEHFRKVPYTLLSMSSEAAARKRYANVTSLVHIDGNHMTDGVELDCIYWLPTLIPRGVAVFHDYHHQDFPGVTEMVDRYTQGWQALGVDDTQWKGRKP